MGDRSILGLRANETLMGKEPRMDTDEHGFGPRKNSPGGGPPNAKKPGLACGGALLVFSEFPDAEEVPLQRVLERRRVPGAPNYGRINSCKHVIDGTCFSGEVKSLLHLGRGTYADDVDDRGHEEAQRPGSYAAVGRNGLLGLKVVFGLGLVLANGLYVHDWSLRLSGVFAKGI